MIWRRTALRTRRRQFQCVRVQRTAPLGTSSVSLRATQIRDCGLVAWARSWLGPGFPARRVRYFVLTADFAISLAPLKNEHQTPVSSSSTLPQPRRTVAARSVCRCYHSQNADATIASPIYWLLSPTRVRHIKLTDSVSWIMPLE